MADISTSVGVLVQIIFRDSSSIEDPLCRPSVPQGMNGNEVLSEV